MTDTMISLPQMLMIGSTGRNSGKTTLAVESIRRWKDKHPVIGLKVTSVEHRDGTCPRGGQGCGACSSLSGCFDLEEESNPAGDKDTARLLAAGCRQVYWLRVLRANMAEGMRAFTECLPPDAVVVCESNSLRRVVEPGVFLMLRNTGPGEEKETAALVLAGADRVVEVHSESEARRAADGLTLADENGTPRVRLA